jgi:hypothetical protein
LDGAYIASFTTGCDIASGERCNVEAVTVDKNDGSVYASYTYSSPPRVVKYKTDGALAEEFATNGILAGLSPVLPFSFPLGLDINYQAGHLLVVDWAHKISVYSTPPPVTLSVNLEILDPI